ncbi:hypothetical protein [Demequina activiva]|uniref:Uncharacterized protein n=1 Tax=Demequina activiva TaxID=1582364 RepID=A0A919Q5C6_9MICO|nr:hypothetical protein [Demequina activiva]GIG55161.1 hypothetical protein Dac01nite_19130 [Demequina activiva]
MTTWRATHDALVRERGRALFGYASTPTGDGTAADGDVVVPFTRALLAAWQ